MPPNPKPPAPFTNAVGKMAGDPAYNCTANDPFNGCDDSWSTIMTGSENIFIAAADCQKALVLLKDNGSNVRFTNLVTIGAKYMVVMDGKGIAAADNLNVKVHPSWSQISVLDVGKDGHTNFDEYVWVDPKIWDMDQRQFTCIPPCRAKIPPWTGATSTVNYPLVTLSDGAWTTTITQPPITITEWVFEPVTIAASQNKKRAVGDTVSLQPTLATTPLWPAFLYRGANGATSTGRASGPFPTPPPHIWGGDASAPPGGSWPKDRHINAVLGTRDFPVVTECFFRDFDGKCLDRWLGIGGSGDGSPPDEENMFDMTASPLPKTSSTTTKPEATTSYYEQGHASTNKGHCYDEGEQTERPLTTRPKMYPSFEEMRSERQAVGMSEEFKRLCWPLSGTFPSAQAVMQTMRGAKEAMEPL
ncbi:Putative LysM domain containing protein [[Torrubiella] hemipterigena]|uniref:Putative LysM domain containing protein n=1 Tax=[Torrubiella] hemipterigena TaxID=1531966 RepID=A0A0A1T705_9HYPO|nr:Putative LysM domain containing protein [[Torrubiella] hemipterigena]